jgi:DNA mismatch repair protein MutS2
MDQHTLQVLEFHKIRQLVSQKTLSPLGRENALTILPMTDGERIALVLQEVSEALGLFQTGGELPLERFRDIRPGLARCLGEGSILEPEELLELSRILVLCREMVAFVKERSGDFPRLEASIGKIGLLEKLRRMIDRRIDLKGQVRDDASKTLRRLRQEQVTLRDRILSTLRSLLSSQSKARSRSEEVITLRDGRYVIPVPSRRRSRVPGVVHDRSASGTTLFIEPAAVIEQGNTLRELEVDEKREIVRILRELTAAVAEEAATIRTNLDVLGHLDLVQAKARLAMELSADVPRISADGVLRLKTARHPLLILLAGEKDEVVPLDLMLGDEVRTVLITGPNTGGKTVALKTLGLLCLMFQAGLPVPAHPDSELPVYVNIYADIGDEQSLEQSLSTFSSHLRQIVKILQGAGPGTLVLLDEIGAGTDPEEGAALAMSILDDLTGRQVHTVATTHFGSLKVYAHDRSGMENASLEFDRTTLRPTYRFHMGLPGSSFALEIADRLGMPDPVVQRASRLIGPEGRKTSEIVEDLQRRVIWYQDKKAELEAEESRLKKMAEEYERKLGDVRQEERRIRERAVRDSQLVLAEANALVEKEVARIREGQASKESIKEAHRRLDERSARLKERRRELTDRPAAPAVELSRGDPVWIKSLQAEGEVVADIGRGDRYKVQVGNLVMELDGADLDPRSEPSRRKKRPAGGVDLGGTESEEGGGEVDLLGLTCEEVVARLEKFMDRALLSGLSTLWIIHGKGTGALRQRVGEFLKGFPGVKGYRLGAWNEGGDGVTVVELE